MLARLRDKPINHPAVQRERKDIIDAIETENQEEGSWLDLFRGAGISAHKRFYLALGIQFMQQMSGKSIPIRTNAFPAFNFLRYQHRDILCSDFIPVEPWDEPTYGTFARSAAAGLVFWRFICHGQYSLGV